MIQLGVRPKALQGWQYRPDGVVTLYRIDEINVTRKENGQIAMAYGDNNVITDPTLCTAVQTAHEDYLRTEAEWIACAKEHAKGSPLLEWVFLASIRYNSGTLEDPTTHDGIAFWKVGRHASLQFYAGVKGDTAYRMSEFYDEENNVRRSTNPVAILDECYWGYY